MFRKGARTKKGKVCGGRRITHGAGMGRGGQKRPALAAGQIVTPDRLLLFCPKVKGAGPAQKRTTLTTTTTTLEILVIARRSRRFTLG